MKMKQANHSIKAAAQKSGLTAHSIRVWEKRYGAVTPVRTASKRRLYSDDEVERLTLLHAATRAGHSIGLIARLPNDRLRELISAGVPASTTAANAGKATFASVVEDCLQAVGKLDARSLEEALGRGSVAFGQHGLLQKVIGPLAHALGEAWRDGTITAAHEHFASAIIRNFLLRNSKPYALNGNTPSLVVVTPSGQIHELGAVMVAAAANDMGWRVTYLGTSLPALEIAAAVTQNHARAIALSIVFPADDPHLPHELETLRKHIPPETKIIVGGRAAEAYRATLDKIGALRARDARGLYDLLEQLRNPQE